MANGCNLLQKLKQQNSYKVAIRYSSEKAEGKLHFETEDGKKSESIVLPSTGGNDKWKTDCFIRCRIKFRNE